jgi:hypothetical protein
MILTFLGSIGAYSMVGNKIGERPQDYSSFIEVYPPLVIYALAYALTGLFLHRTLLPRRRAVIAGVLALVLATVAAIGPNILLFCMNDLSWKSLQRLQLGNASNLFGDLSSEERMQHLWFACIWLMIAMILNARWFVRQVNNFRPPQKIAAPPFLAGLPPAVTE